MCDKCKPKYQNHLHVRLQLAAKRAKEELEIAELALTAYQDVHKETIATRTKALIERYGR